ncbi:MAG TPA: fibronectin type III domain-containing protein [Solirubrobacteraceae bacterium]|nr:fibronectin type III domain-containing protein [Solirubrobacteraceae bacterium]
MHNARLIAATLTSLAITLGGIAVSAAGADTVTHTKDGLYTATFSCQCKDGTTGSKQMWTVPSGVFQATFRAYGAEGGTSLNNGGVAGGLGGEAEDVFDVTPGERLDIIVGGQPDSRATGNGTGGYNGGGSGGNAYFTHGGSPADSANTFTGAGGGGASDLEAASGTILLVGGGGGGSGSNGTGVYQASSGQYVAPDGGGGAGGGKTGAEGIDTYCYTLISGPSWVVPPLGGGGGPGSQTQGGGATNCVFDPGVPTAAPGRRGQGGGGQTGDVGDEGMTQNYPPEPIISLAGGGGGGGGGYFGGGGGSSSVAGDPYPYAPYPYAGGWLPYPLGGGPGPANGAGGGAGGGGGSSYGPHGAKLSSGVRSGDGEVTIRYRYNCSSKYATCIRALSAVQNLTATPGDGRVSASWAPPTHGNYITDYVVAESKGRGRGYPKPVHTYHTTKTHLTASAVNGVPYFFTVYAVNKLGDGTSSKVGPVIPDPRPVAPSVVHAVAGVLSATVSFPPGSAVAGAPILSYTVTANNGKTARGAQPITIKDLSPGQFGLDGVFEPSSYTFTVTATNRIGSTTSVASNAVEPFTTPTAPTQVSAVGGNAQATVSFTPGLTYGQITTYTVTSSQGQMAMGSGSPITVTNLTNGTSYTFTVVASNFAGPSPASVASNAVTPETVPGAPTGVSGSNVTPGTVSVSFTPPASDGGAPITGYEVTGTSSDGGTSASMSGASSPITVSGVSPAHNYTFTVDATNSAGTGPLSLPSAQLTTCTIASGC